MGGRCTPESAHLGWEDVVSHIPDLGAQAWELRHSQTLEFHRHAADEATRGLVALLIDKHPPAGGQRGQSWPEPFKDGMRLWATTPSGTSWTCQVLSLPLPRRVSEPLSVPKATSCTGGWKSSPAPPAGLCLGFYHSVHYENTLTGWPGSRAPEGLFQSLFQE